MARIPQAVHKTKDRPTEPDLCRMAPGLMKIPDPGRITKGYLNPDSSWLSFFFTYHVSDNDSYATQ